MSVKATSGEASASGRHSRQIGALFDHERMLNTIRYNTCASNKGCAYTSGTRHIIPLTPRRQVLCQPYHYKSSAVAEMGDRGHNRHGPKRGGCCAPFAGAGTPPSTMWPGPRSTSVPSGASSIQPFGNNRLGPKIGWGWVCPFFWG